MSLEQFALEVQNISKSFSGNAVLQDISFGISKGEVLGLLGSNGAGKSTLMKIITGVYQKDNGRILINGKEVHIKDAHSAGKNAIAMVYQDFSLIPTLTVAQNLFLGVEPKRGFLIQDRKIKEKTKEILDQFGINIEPDTVLGSLSMGSQQLIEIAKTLLKKPSLLILDEPTASLTAREIDFLFDLIARLKKDGIAVFFISHHLQEIMRVCDRVVVLRNGKVELNESVKALSISRIIQAMVNKDIYNEYLAPSNQTSQTEPILRVENIRYRRRVNGVSLEVRAGEIVGIAGLLGSGRTELLECIAGIRRYDCGKVMIQGEVLTTGKPWTAINKGIFLIPENRRLCGIVGIHSMTANMMMPIWKKFREALFLLDDRKAGQTAEKMREKIDIGSNSVQQILNTLSGGNQQKVVFAKGLLTEHRLLLLDDPTTGIDVDAKSSIARLIRETADAGNGILIVSSEFDELARLCDRVLVMRNGGIHAQMTRRQDEITETSLNHAVQT